MTGFCGLKTLLLWAGLLGLATCQNKTETTLSPSTITTSTNHSLPASIPTSQAMSQTSQTDNQNATECKYSISNIKYGLKIDLNEPTLGNYTVWLTEFEQKTNQMYHKIANNNPLELKGLKPNTNYNVTLMVGNITCKSTGKHSVLTEKMDETDITTDTTSVKGSLCYISEWNITDAMQENSTDVLNSSCIKLEISHFCSQLKTTFKNSNFLYKTSNISLNLFETSLIEINVNTTNAIPLKPKWINSPLNCGNISDLEYSCQDNEKKLSVTINELEPYTNYSCTGSFKHNNQITNKTGLFNVYVDCGITLNVEKNEKPTNTSISLKWSPKISEQKCNKTHLQKLSYTVCWRTDRNSSCRMLNETNETFTGLQSYKNHTFNVTAKYFQRNATIEKNTPEVNVSTAPGIPKKLKIEKATLQEHNYLRIKCEPLREEEWNGPGRKYFAHLNNVEHKKNNCEFDFVNLNYLTSYKLKIFAYNGYHNSTPEERDLYTRYNDKAAIGFLAFLIVLTSLALVFILHKIFILHRKKSGNNDERLELIPSNGEDSLMTVEPIGAEMLLDAYKSKIADDGRLFLAEFQSVPRIFSSYSVKEARKSCNQTKNRYVDILPYDYNRVHLSDRNREAGSDYINASFIDGYKESKKYIAAQGPKDETLGDFWRMVWEQQSSIIVMVTRCEEGNRAKCAQYWPSPEREAEIFEEFVVKLIGEDYCPDYIIRHLSLTNKIDKSAEREVTHIQFTSWPDHGVPGEPHLLLKLRRRVNAFKNLFSGPIVVHCSAGVGRTGTYISIDAMMEGLDSEGRVDIYGYVVRLRRQRCLMVQVEAQYILIHQALIEHNQFGETEIPLSDLHSLLGTFRKRGPDNEPTVLEAEFQRLPKYKNWRTFNTAITEENKKKNRFLSFVPYDYNRVLVKLEEERSNDSDQYDDDDDSTSDEEDEVSAKYINASYVDSYWCPRFLVAAQGPLPDTRADFWQMVLQKRTCSIVMLSDCTENDQEFCSPYWGDNKMTYGDMEVDVTATETSAGYTLRTMQISHAKRNESHQVKHYHFLKWAGRELPENPQDLTEMIKNIKEACGCDNRGQVRSMPIVVHCGDGSSRSGVFCALWNLLDSAATEKLVDVFQVAKALRKERQGMINSLEQYQFLYNAVEGAFPVQNGEVKQAANPVAGSVQIINETETKQPVQEGSTASHDQQDAAAQSVPLVADSGEEASAAESEGGSTEPSVPSEASPLGGTCNGPQVTVDV